MRKIIGTVMVLVLLAGCGRTKRDKADGKGGTAVFRAGAAKPAAAPEPEWRPPDIEYDNQLPHKPYRGKFRFPPKLRLEFN